MEFLRFGSSIPGIYWGCCAVCIIQNFKFDPDAKASSQVVNGDAGTPMFVPGKPGEMAFVGPTYRDIFNSRLRFGTFSTSDMPNHAFFAILTEQQINGTYGKKWLAILKENGFEFLRTQDNSVYTGASLGSKVSSHPNHIFALFRNITGSRIKDPFTPPKAWRDLPEVVPEPWQMISADDVDSLAFMQTKAHTELWKKGKTVFMTEAELREAGAPVMLSGRRVEEAKPHVKKDERGPAAPSPFAVASPAVAA